MPFYREAVTFLLFSGQFKKGPLNHKKIDEFILKWF